MAEIEHFVDPNDKSHPKFRNVASKIVVLFPADAQLGTGRTVEITIGEAVRTGLVNNETLGYFMARTQMFFERIGIDKNRMRFRQHLKTEMAHYAADCWDMEVKLLYGWIETVGHADRSCYDLEQHSKKTGIPLLASTRLAEPITVDKLVVEPNKKLLGPKFKNDQKTVISLLETIDGEELELFKREIEANGKSLIGGQFEITADLVTFKEEKKVIYEKKFTPGVIEPSYGIGRILYSVFEHSFSHRDGDEQRCVMSFRPCVAPIKVGIYRLINNVAFDPIVSKIHSSLQKLNIANKVDSSSGTVGRRYSRADELGIPFGVTIDFQSIIDDTVTLRERDSMTQVRIAISKLIEILQLLILESIDWEYIKSRFPVVQSSGDDDEEEGDSDTAAVSSASVPSNKANTRTIVDRSVRASFSRPNPNYSSE